MSLPNAQMVGQIDMLESMGVPVTHLEMGNEKANPCGLTADAHYLETVRPVVARARALFPDAKVGIIGSWANPASISPLVNWTGCAKMLAAHRNADGVSLFDAVTVHQYMPGNNTLSSYPVEQQRSVTLATAEPLLRYHVATVADNIGPDVPIWLDEYNWGGNWEGATTWPGETLGALRGALMSSYILSAIGTEGGVQALNWYSLFAQDGNGWSQWASCVKVSNQADRVGEIEVDGVAQIFNHWTYVAFALGHTTMQAVRDVGPASAVLPMEVLHASGIPCIQAAAFAGGPNGSTTFVSLNRCDKTVPMKWPLMSTRVIEGVDVVQTIYSAAPENAGGYVLLSEIQSVDMPPWRNGPLQPTVTTQRFHASNIDDDNQLLANDAPPFSLSFIHAAAPSARSKLKN
jgi:hypothetical protein